MWQSVEFPSFQHQQQQQQQKKDILVGSGVGNGAPERDLIAGSQVEELLLEHLVKTDFLGILSRRDRKEK